MKNQHKEVAFIHLNAPKKSAGTNAATQYLQELRKYDYDITVYCPKPDDPGLVDTSFNTEWLEVNMPFRHSGKKLNKSIKSRADELGSFDIVHTYSMKCLEGMGIIGKETDASTIVSLNAYGAICPKNDLRFFDKKQCTGNHPVKCTACGAHKAVRNSIASSKRFPLNPVTVAHDFLYYSGNFNLIESGSAYLDHIDRFHVLSPHMVDIYKEFGFDVEKMSIVPVMTDEGFNVPHQSNFSSPIRLLYVGELDHHKGVHLLPDILSQLNEAGGREYELTIVGDGPLKASMDEEMGKLGQADNATFKGFVDNSKLPEIYSRHDIFLYPGQVEEAFGRVFLEALASGTPVVASNVGSVVDIVGAGGVVTDGSIGEFVRQISQLETDQWQSMSVSAKDKSKEYESETVGKGMKEIYSAVVQ